jgi:hypothetical protein
MLRTVWIYSYLTILVSGAFVSSFGGSSFGSLGRCFTGVRLSLCRRSRFTLLGFSPDLEIALQNCLLEEKKNQYIKKDYVVSSVANPGCFIPDPNIFHFGSRIRIPKVFIPDLKII